MKNVDSGDDGRLYAIADYNLLKDNPCELSLFLLIRARSRKKGYCFTSNHGFMDFFGTSLNNIIRWKKSLEKRGYIRIEKGGGHSASKIYPLFNIVASDTKISSTEISSTKNDMSSTKNDSAGVLKTIEQQYHFQYPRNIKRISKSNINSNSVCGGVDTPPTPTPTPTSDNDTPKKSSTRKKFVPPTLEEAQNYFAERAEKENIILPEGIAEKFINHYTANGWYVGKNKMKNWKASVRVWIINEKDSGKAKKAVQSISSSSTEHNNNMNKMNVY